MRTESSINQRHSESVERSAAVFPLPNNAISLSAISPSHNRHTTYVAFGIQPERLGQEAVEDFERQDGFAFGGFDLRAYRVQAGHADARVEFAGAVFDAVEVVFEPRLADELINLAQCGFGASGQGLVGQQHQMAGRVLAVERILDGLE